MKIDRPHVRVSVDYVQPAIERVTLTFNKRVGEMWLIPPGTQPADVLEVTLTGDEARELSEWLIKLMDGARP